MKDLSKEQLNKILADDDLGIFSDDASEEEILFAEKFTNALLKWVDKHPENKKFFNL